MEVLRIDLPPSANDRGYDILIQDGVLARAGDFVRPVTRARKALMVSDQTVDSLFGEAVRRSLGGAGISVSTLVLPPGEQSKSLSTLERIYNAGMDFGLTRQDAMIALGGGVVGDVTGFAAATLLRGMDFIQIPTTLLAQVDSSVGGKVAVNLDAGKNLAGAFYQPKLVLIDPACLDTLADRVFSDGMAEVIKYGAIFSQPLLLKLESMPERSALMPGIIPIILECCDLKRQVVVEDELDKGRRMLLNFGHTLGHAYEAAYKYERFTHGEAVSAGMCLAAAMGENLGLTEPGTRDRLASLVRKFSLPDKIRCARKDYEKALSLDKKGLGQDINLILLASPGKAFIHKMPRQEALELAESLQES